MKYVKFGIWVIPFLVLFYAGCLDLPNDLVLPEWDVELNVPIANRFYTLDDIIGDQNYLSIDEDNDSLYIIQSDVYEVSTGVDEFLVVASEASINDIPVPTGAGEQSIFLGSPEGAQIYSAVLRSGRLFFNASNQSITDSLILDIKLPALVSPAGDTLDVHLAMPPSGTDSETIFLTGYTYKEPENQPDEEKGQIWIIAEARTTGTTENYAIFDAHSSDFYFSSITGYLPSKSLGQEASTFSLDLGEDADFYRDKIILANAELNLSAEYRSQAANPFSVGIKNLQITGRKNNGEQIQLQFNNSQSLDIMFKDGKFETVFTQDNSNITEFLTFIPDNITVSADYIMNPENDHEYKTATDKDSVVFMTDFNTTSILAFRETTIKDTTEVGFSQDDRDAVDNTNYAELNVEVENAIPLTALITIDLLDKNYNKLFSLTDAQGSDTLGFTGAVVDDATGEVITPTTSMTGVTLDSLEIEKFADAEYAVISTTLRTRDGNIENPPLVAFHASDWLKMKVYGTLNYHVKDEENGGSQQ